MSWFETHLETLEQAVEAVAARGAWTPFVESPSRRLHPAGAKAAGREWFDSSLGRPYPLQMPGATGLTGAEVSPYTRAPLGIEYPRISVEPLYAAMSAAIPNWRDAGVQPRVGVCIEILHRLAQDVFSNAFATMHTAGQPFMTAFAGSGANSLDRGLEALAYAYKAMRDVPQTATFSRKFAGTEARLEKRYRLIPRGIACVISCGSYPAWNAYPSIMANLACGNAVVVKPHPECILPMARTVEIARGALAEAGYDPNLVTLAADTRAEPVTKLLLMHPATAIIDFTGGAKFGAWIEDNCRHADVYTETAGCNAVVIDSVVELTPVLEAIAQSLCLFSGQMCTTPQNIFVPPQVRTSAGSVSREDFIDGLVQAIDRTVEKSAPGLCGAIENDAIIASIDALRGQHVLREPTHYIHPDYPAARTATPILVQSAVNGELHRREHFGPMAFVIPTDSAEQGLDLATRDARECGSIANYAYTTDESFLAAVQDAFAFAGASVGCNLINQRPINFTAAFSDYHVTGLNPAGNACLTDLAFVTRRFRIVQSKTEVP